MPARADAPVTLDPYAANQGTALVVAPGAGLLSPNGQPARSIAFALARGVQIDTASRNKLCSLRSAARGACPDASRIGFGRYMLSVAGYQTSGEGTQLAWALDAYLGAPEKRGDAASVVLIGQLLGADLVNALLAPSLGTAVPAKTATIGRLRRASGKYGVELEFATLPVQLDVAAPITATPSAFELTLSAVRNVRQNFTRSFKVKMPSGYQVRKVHDHRLVGHHLLHTPSSCKGSWPAEVRVGLPSGIKRTAIPIPCTATLTG